MSSIYERRDNGDGSYSTNTAITDSDAILPMGVEYRRQKSIQTHTSAVAVANGVANGPWMDTDGYNELVSAISNDAAVNSQIHIHWSNDGVNLHALEMTNSNALQNYAYTTGTKLKWARVVFKNMDGTAPHTMNGFAYLKA
jgi:hypothetical protein